MRASPPAALAACFVVVIACDGSRRRPVPDVVSEQPAYVAVTNNHLSDVAVYVVRAGARFRIGTVRGGTTDTLVMGPSVPRTGFVVQLLAAPIGSTRFYVTEPIRIQPDQWMTFDVNSPINLSYVSRWYR
ncbi:MAG TPA: hypothetical protein VJ717_12955 [Gemmatimonadaceae bacterium]|nr:hypothetical protein [Gemmatimonadaceae bacterium]